MSAVPVIGAEVYTSDGHQVGRVIEVTTKEFFVEGGRLLKIFRLFPLSSVRSATDERVEVTFSEADLAGRWNVITIRDHRGRDRHVTQIGTPPVASVPEYDEVQTTTGGPPTDEADR